MVLLLFRANPFRLGRRSVWSYGHYTGSLQQSSFTTWWLSSGSRELSCQMIRFLLEVANLAYLAPMGLADGRDIHFKIE